MTEHNVSKHVQRLFDYAATLGLEVRKMDTLDGDMTEGYRILNPKDDEYTITALAATEIWVYITRLNGRRSTAFKLYRRANRWTTDKRRKEITKISGVKARIWASVIAH